MIERLGRFFDGPFGADVLAAYLFGSRAAGRAHRESDVDVGVLVDRQRLETPRERFDLRLRLIGALGHALGVGADRVDVVLLNDAWPTITPGVGSPRPPASPACPGGGLGPDA